MQIIEIYKGLKDQADRFDGLEGQILGLLETNRRNMELIKTAKTINSLSFYFDNQHGIFNTLLEAVNDAKIVNSYQLLEVEAQLREEAKL